MPAARSPQAGGDGARSDVDRFVIGSMKSPRKVSVWVSPPARRHRRGPCGDSRQFLHRCDESISLTGNGDDVVVLVRTLAKRPPHRRDLTRQVVLVDGGVRPHPVQELVFADDVVPMFEEHDEHVEVFDEIGTRRPSAPQPSLDGVDDERTEGKPGPIEVSRCASKSLYTPFGVVHRKPVGAREDPSANETDSVLPLSCRGYTPADIAPMSRSVQRFPFSSFQFFQPLIGHARRTQTVG